MKLQFQVLLFVVCLNLATGLVIGLGLPGTEYVSPARPGVTAEEYEAHFNGTETVEGWQAVVYDIPIIGDIFAGLSFLWNNFRYLIDGFPMLLTWMSDTYIVDVGTQTAFTYVSGALRALYAIMVTVLAIEFISGREVTD